MDIYKPHTVDLFEIDSKRTNKDYYTSVMNYFRNKVTVSNNNIESINKLIHGELSNSDYNWILNPYNATEDRFKKYPGKLVNMDIIMPIVRRFIGEYLKSYNSFHIVSKLPNEENTFLNDVQEYMQGLLVPKVQAHVTQAVNEATGQNEPVDKEALNMNLGVEYERFKTKWKDEKTITDNNLLEFLKASTNDDFIYLKAYTNWIIYGEYYIDRWVSYDDIKKEVIPPGHGFPIKTNSDFIDGSEAFLIRKQYSMSEVLAEFRSRLTDDNLKYLKAIYNSYSSSGETSLSTQILLDHFGPKATDLTQNGTVNIMNGAGNFNVDKLYFKAFKEIKILEYIDVLGEIQTVEVDKNYKLDKEFGDIKLTSEFIPTVYLMYCIGEARGGIYLEPIELEVQRTKIDNIGDCLIPVTGKSSIINGFPTHSIPLTLEYYQKAINILYLVRERAIARNHGKIGIFPRGLLGNGDPVKEEETIYRMTSTGFAFPDDSSPNFANSIQGLKAIDLSDHNYIESLSRMIIEIKELANEAVDMNRQRAGETYASDGKFTTEQAIIRSSLGSAIINETFNNSRCRDYEADIDFTKVAWKKGKKGKFISSDRKVLFFEINPLIHRDTEYASFCDNSLKNNDRVNKLQELAFSAAQNGEFDIAINAIDTEDLSKLKEILLQYQAMRENDIKEQNKREQENAQMIAQGTENAEKIKQDNENMRNKLDNQTQLLIAKLKLATTTPESNNDQSQSDEVEMLKQEIDNLNKQLESQS